MSYYKEYFKTLSGTWSETEGVYKGVIDSTLTARAIRGSESDVKYEVHVTVNITSGKAAVIVFFTYTEDWEEKYIEMVLDPASNKVTLEGVVRNADGSEKTRTTLASRDMTLSTATDYDVRMVATVASDGTGSVYGFIDAFEAVRATDLVSPYVAGMHGFECLGTADQYTEFSGFKHVGITTYYCNLPQAKAAARLVNWKDLGFDEETEYDAYVKEIIGMASRYIDDHCQRPADYFNGGATVTEYHDGKEKRSSDFATFHEAEQADIKRRRTFYLRQTPAISITTIKENVAVIGSSDDWKTRTETTHYRPNLKMGRIRFASGYIPNEGTDNIEFIYVAGYSSVPKVVEWVCSEMVGNYLQGGIGDRSAQYIRLARPEPMDFSSPQIFTKEMKERLQRYVKRRI